MEHDTEYGKVSTDELLRVYHLWKKMIEKTIERRNEFNQTEEGKQKNRANAKNYYQRNREKILEKHKIRYENKKNQYQMQD